MTLSVGLGRIINDPKATILTRKALGALSNPALLVTDKGLTIDNSGRLVLRLASGSGLSEDSNGLSVKLAPNGGITVDSNGLSVDAGSEFDVLTCNSLIVNTVATVATLNAGAVASSGNVSGVNAIFSGGASLGSATITGALSAGSAAIAGAITGASVSVSGNITGATVAATGAITGATVAATGAITGASLSVSAGIAGASASITGTIGAAIASITGALGAGTARIGSGTTIKKVLSFYTILSVPASYGTLDFTVTCAGAIAGSLAVCSPMSIPDDTFDAWSCGVESDGYVRIRLLRDGYTTYPAVSIDFRIVTIEFS